METNPWPRLLLLMLGLVFATASLATPFRHTETSNTMSVTLTMQHDPPTVGKNTMTINILDDQGKPITDVKVKVNYRMSPMAGMMPMRYKTTAKWSGDKYIAQLDMAMAGA